MERRRPSLSLSSSSSYVFDVLVYVPMALVLEHVAQNGMCMYILIEMKTKTNSNGIEAIPKWEMRNEMKKEKSDDYDGKLKIQRILCYNEFDSISLT